MKKYDEKICRCALNRIFGFRPVTALALLEKFGSGETLFSMGPKGLLDAIGAGVKDITKICDQEYEEAEQELREVEKGGARFLSENEPDYPALLKECSDRPVGLYVRSKSPDSEIFSDSKHYVAVVGTRDISNYGSEWCSRIVSAVAGTKEGPTIVSGLALGTDIIAHRKALETGVPTIAVLPTGIDAIYPYRHHSDAWRISETQGCALVTDYPPNTVPQPFNFLRRNRIIAGICEATILIESKIKGGGMMTARLAASYSRDVYALPGRLGDLRSQGCNALINEKVAEPIFSEETLTKSLGLTAAGKRKKVDGAKIVERKFSGKMSREWIDKLAAVLLAIKEAGGGADIEQISRRCGLNYGETAELISLLETDGLVYVDFMQRCSINYNGDGK